jgi:hypothetical protein
MKLNVKAQEEAKSAQVWTPANSGCVVFGNGKHAADVTLAQMCAQDTARIIFLVAPCGVLRFPALAKDNALCNMPLNLYGRQKNIPPFI